MPLHCRLSGFFVPDASSKADDLHSRRFHAREWCLQVRNGGGGILRQTFAMCAQTAIRTPALVLAFESGVGGPSLRKGEIVYRKVGHHHAN